MIDGSPRRRDGRPVFVDCHCGTPPQDLRGPVGAGPAGLHGLSAVGGRDSLEPDGADPLTGAAPVSDLELDATERLIDSWLEAAAGSKEAIAAVERGPEGARRWYVRVTGDEKEVWTIWFTLGQRTLHYETYLVPAPEENHAQFYEHLLRRNRRLTGLKLEIGPEDAVFLSGSMPVMQVTPGALDGILGSMYAATELIFRPAMRIGYASKFHR
ncbi:MAG: hypothetical protein F4Z00_04235 [Acidimicrobiaceae bacterium]|nr:hypothetical protein [Acidimicrobiaceae bacterium]MXZ64741.1 hypothetical protein [Acidimicrobiaceae bacterium]MYF32196.1 hypothetical protein [Acidimicrobiaceae bacterium]MYG78207.1 hypothetical protein [Acidimicrobiaceae bacterium]MYJ29937.1 hypothetical protein [Acidimicrobiaceae bacterium]